MPWHLRAPPSYVNGGEYLCFYWARLLLIHLRHWYGWHLDDVADMTRIRDHSIRTSLRDSFPNTDVYVSGFLRSCLPTLACETVSPTIAPQSVNALSTVLGWHGRPSVSSPLKAPPVIGASPVGARQNAQDRVLSTVLRKSSKRLTCSPLSRAVLTIIREYSTAWPLPLTLIAPSALSHRSLPNLFLELTPTPCPAPLGVTT